MPITTLEDEFFRMEQGKEYAAKLAHLKKEVRMLRDASIELYVDADNYKWRAERAENGQADVRNPVETTKVRT